MTNPIDEIRPLIIHLQQLQQAKLQMLSHQVWEIVEGHQPFYAERADHLLDELLGLADFGIGEDLFKAFLAYVDALDPQLSADYRSFYRDFVEEDNAVNIGAKTAVGHGYMNPSPGIS